MNFHCDGCPPRHRQDSAWTPMHGPIDDVKNAQVPTENGMLNV